jgi:hypothetical protein
MIAGIVDETRSISARAARATYQHPPVLRLLVAISQTKDNLVHKDRRHIHTLQKCD